MKFSGLLVFLVAGLICLPFMGYGEDISALRKKAEQGDATARYRLGAAYAFGDGVTQDYKEAVNLWQLSAQQGNAYAQYNLGVLYSQGQGVLQNDMLAVKYYRLAAEQGLAKAQYNLGAAYYNGTGVPKDHTEAARWFRLAKEQESTQAQSLSPAIQQPVLQSIAKHSETFCASNVIGVCVIIVCGAVTIWVLFNRRQKKEDSMGNELDELNGPVNQQGRDINVIEKRIPVKVGFGSTLFEIVLWVIGILPGLIFLFMKIQAKNYFRQLEQKIQADASQIDNFLEQRVQILQNVVPLVSKAIDLDKDVMKTVAAFRGGAHADSDRNIVSGHLDQVFGRLFPQVEAYPDLKAHAAIADAMRQNSYLQKEITAARTLYNDTVNIWNSDVFAWPTKMIVAARAGYTTRIPFTASTETKALARSTFF